MKYVKKPVVVEAFQFGVDKKPDWFLIHRHGKWKIPQNAYYLDIDRDQPDHRKSRITFYKGDWVILGTHGEIYPCKKDIFDASYEPYNEEKKDD